MSIEKNVVNRSVLLAALAALILACPAGAAQKKGPLKVFLLAGQSNMEGHAELRTIDFLGEDPDKDRAALLKKFKPDGKTLVKRATSNLGYHYFGEGRFFILLGKAMAETMQELMGTGDKR
jgi:hypothetical protein